MLSPPYISVSKITPYRYSMCTAMDDWLKVNNFFLEALEDNVLKSFMMNNTTICLKMDNDNEDGIEFFNTFVLKRLNLKENFKVNSMSALLK